MPARIMERISEDRPNSQLELNRLDLDMRPGALKEFNGFRSHALAQQLVTTFDYGLGKRLPSADAGLPLQETQ